MANLESHASSAPTTKVTVSRVVRHETPAGLDFGFEAPRPGDRESVWSLPLRGWLLGLDRPYFRLQLDAGAGAPTYLPVRFSRPDVASANRGMPWARRCGVEGRVNVAWLPRRFALQLAAVRKDETPVALMTISGERSALPAQPADALQPVTITTLGRSGSVLLSWILDQHPQLLAPHPYEYEPRVAAYFFELFRVMSNPESYSQALTGAIAGNEWWLGDGREMPHRQVDEVLERWLGSVNVEQALALCAGRIEAFYRRVAEREGCEAPRGFVEKYPPNHFLQDLQREVYPGMRELFLVRDFRDVACSMIAYASKVGSSWTRPPGITDDEQFIRYRLGTEVRDLADRWATRRDGALVVRYEDLVSNMPATVSRLLEFVGVDSAAGTVERMLDPSGEEQLAAAQAGHGTTSSAEQSVGRWRRELNPSLQQACAETFGEALQLFGYADR